MGIKKSLKKRGFAGTLRWGCLKALGLEKYREEIDTLQYFLDKCADITAIKPTNDSKLRNMQLAMVQLLRIFDKLCEKNDLTYWLGCGNLIGAVRHKGFIPWDDDVDVVMPREDYEKVIPLMKPLLEPYGIIVRWGGHFDDAGYMARLALDYRTLETGVWMDIFPIDHCNCADKLDGVRNDLKKAISEYCNYYKKAEKKDSIDTIKEKKAAIFGQYDSLQNGINKVYFRSIEFADVGEYNDEETIFPLRKLEYEGYFFPVPNETDKYLRGLYGDYMKFPRYGVETHLDPDGQKASTRAERHNIDMNEVIAYLKNVYEKI